MGTPLRWRGIKCMTQCGQVVQMLLSRFGFRLIQYTTQKILHIPLKEFVRKKTNVEINMFPYEDVSKHNVKLLKLESSLLR